MSIWTGVVSIPIISMTPFKRMMVIRVWLALPLFTHTLRTLISMTTRQQQQKKQQNTQTHMSLFRKHTNFVFFSLCTLQNARHHLFTFYWSKWSLNLIFTTLACYIKVQTLLKRNRGQCSFLLLLVHLICCDVFVCNLLRLIIALINQIDDWIL